MVFWRGEENVLRKAAGRWCSSYGAELTAMKAAAEEIRRERPMSALIITDSQALTRTLEKDEATLDTDLEDLKRDLVAAAEDTRITVQGSRDTAESRGMRRRTGRQIRRGWRTKTR